MVMYQKGMCVSLVCWCVGSIALCVGSNWVVCNNGGVMAGLTSATFLTPCWFHGT